MMPWQPVASPQQWRRRAQLLATIRHYFASHDVLEVETPLLCQAAGTDPQLDFFTSQGQIDGQALTLYLQTSPEFAMKRLLAAGSGSIYQICKAFRQGESGRYHNPEFTLLEWYRVGFDLSALMDDVASLLSVVLPSLPTQRIAYSTLFNLHTDLDPLQFQRDVYRQQAQTLGFPEADVLCGDEHAVWLDFLFSHAVQPKMSHQHIIMVYGYPAVLSSLARLNTHDPRISERVEVFINGIELGNGYHELTDAHEQDRRFTQELAYRAEHSLPRVAKDQRLLAALTHGLPDCSGIALGLDRLMMITEQLDHIHQVLTFPINRA